MNSFVEGGGMGGGGAQDIEISAKSLDGKRSLSFIHVHCLPMCIIRQWAQDIEQC